MKLHEYGSVDRRECKCGYFRERMPSSRNGVHREAVVGMPYSGQAKQVTGPQRALHWTDLVSVWRAGVLQVAMQPKLNLSAQYEEQEKDPGELTKLDDVVLRHLSDGLAA